MDMKYTADGTRTGSPDMTGQDRTVEADATACQERCQNTDGCSYFTWWGNDGGCHLQNSSAIATDEINNPEKYGVISGPKSCNPGKLRVLLLFLFYNSLLTNDLGLFNLTLLPCTCRIRLGGPYAKDLERQSMYQFKKLRRQ